MTMFERFTDRARRSLALALQQAQAANQAVGAEHILLGLLGEGDGQVESGIASRALTAEGFSLRGMQETIRKIYETGDDKPWSVHEPYASSGKRVLNQGLREAIQLGHNWIGTEHLLLAVLDDDSLVERLSLPTERIRDRVLKVLGVTKDAEEEEGDDGQQTVRDVAWTLFAGQDATYVTGEYAPSEDELSLANKFIESLTLRGYKIVRMDR
jgi:ATP-dependent Clp protease ATP-binding subunit ClpC